MEVIKPLPEEFMSLHNLMPQLNEDEVLQNIEHQPILEKAYSKLFVKLQSSKNEKSSAYLEMNGTKVMVKIVPPRDIPPTDSSKKHLAEIEVDIRFLEAAERTYKHDRHESMLHREVGHILENVICRSVYTNMIFEVFILVIDDNGCALSLIINCCILALIKGGISVYDLVTSSTVCMYAGALINNPSGHMADLLDRASTSMQNRNFGIMTYSQLGGIGLSPQVFCSGCFTPGQFKLMMERCHLLNGVLRNKFKKILRKSVIASNREWQIEDRERLKMREIILKIAENRQLGAEQQQQPKV